MTFEFDEIAPEKLETLVAGAKRIFKDPVFRAGVKRVAQAVAVAAAVTAVKYGWKEWKEYRENKDDLDDIIDTMTDLI